MLFWQPDYDFDKSMAEIRNIALNLIDIKFWCSIWSNIVVIDKETDPGKSDNPLMMPQQKCLRWKEKELCIRVLLLLSILNPRLLWRTIRRDERRLTSLGCPPLPCTALLVSMGENPCCGQHYTHTIVLRIQIQTLIHSCLGETFDMSKTHLGLWGSPMLPL